MKYLRLLPGSVLCVSLLLGACAEAPEPAPVERAADASADFSPLLYSPEPEPQALVRRIAFGSCFKVQRDGHDIWSTIATTAPDLFIFNGDTLYPDKENEDAGLPSLAAAYRQLSGVAEFTALRKAVPVLPLWDDHDYGMNDGGADFPRREDAERLFEAAWLPRADDPRRSYPGVYHAVTLGPAGKQVQVILLDTRFFRSSLRVTDSRGAPGRERYLPDPDPAKTLLGQDQWRWLEAQLRQPAALRIVVSSIQVLADGHGWESWRQLPAEQERLFELLRRYGDTPALLLSGDRHVAGFYEHDIGLGQPLLEFTSSALNNDIPMPYRRNTLAEPGPRRLGALYGDPNFGLLEIDWEREVVRLLLKDRDGGTVRELPWSFAAPQDTAGAAKGDGRSLAGS